MSLTQGSVKQQSYSTSGAHGLLTAEKKEVVDVDDDEQEEEVVVEDEGEGRFCLGQEHDSRAVREREGSEWPPDH